jgi:hypothetical protein
MQLQVLVLEECLGKMRWRTNVVGMILLAEIENHFMDIVPSWMKGSTA